MNFSIFPNLLLIGNQIQVIEPVTVDRTVLTWYATSADGVPDEITTMRMRHQEDFPAFGEPNTTGELPGGVPARAGDPGGGVGDDGSRAPCSVPEEVDDRGVITDDETAPRGYFSYWRTLMERQAVRSRPRNRVTADA